MQTRYIHDTNHLRPRTGAPVSNVLAFVSGAQRPVTVVTDKASAERARLLLAERAALLASGRSVTYEQIAEATGRNIAAVRQWVSRQSRAGALITVTHEGVVYVPTFQLTDTFELSSAAAEIVRALTSEGVEGWGVWGWFAAPNSWLSGQSPEAVLAAGDIGRLRRATAGEFQE